MRELSLHILDLVRNSVEAGASIVELEVCEDPADDLLTICVRDNGRGMSQEECRRVTDPFVTTRTTRRVGLGLPLIDMSTRRCGGYLTIDSKPGQGTVVTAAYQHSHLDRPPLGNMVDTVKTLVIGNPLLDFRYMHIVGSRKFVLKTLEITEALGDIPLTQPEVLEWLQEHLVMNFAILYGGAKNENN
jgi:anti-sigma regulatory factor (Ser/Thr protein kinase)